MGLWAKRIFNDHRALNKQRDRVDVFRLCRDVIDKKRLIKRTCGEDKREVRRDQCVVRIMVLAEGLNPRVIRWR